MPTDGPTINKAMNLKGVGAQKAVRKFKAKDIDKLKALLFLNSVFLINC